MEATLCPLTDCPHRLLLTIPPLAVIGEYVENRHPNVQHAALTNDAVQAEFGQAISVTHMGPPLAVAQTSVHVAGWVDNLTPDEVNQLRHWLHLAREEMVTGDPVPDTVNRDYVLHPPYESRPTEIPGRTQFRCSCAGLVLWAYERINIPLLNWQHPAMPVAQGLLLRALAHEARKNRNLLPPNKADWRVVNAGYLFHALNRSDADIRAAPYLPQSQAEIAFPL